MTQSQTAGRFITFEGGEGAGKSTQCSLLAAYLRDRGMDVHLTREPGGTEGAEALRSLVLHHPEFAWDTTSELLIFLAARRDHIQKVIRPLTEKGTWVICDRFQDSTNAYQGYACGMGMSYTNGLYSQICGSLQPDLTLILDMDVEAGLQRARKVTGDQTKDRFEDEALTFHQKLREGFHAIANMESERCHLIDATGAIEEVSTHIISAVEQRFLESD